MLLSIAIIAISTTGIGLLPSYDSIGVIAPLLLVIFRFLQGIAVGGDLPGAITFVAEHAENHQRGLYCSFVYCAVNLGLLLASFIGGLLTLLLTPEALMAWGWRLAFLLGLIISVIGFYLRSKILETPHFSTLEKSKKVVKTPVLYLLKTQKTSLLQGIGLVWLFAVIIAQLFLYMPTYLKTMRHLELSTALIINSFNILVFSLFIPVIGHLSDRVGRKPVIITTACLFILFTYPLYSLLLSESFLAQSAALLSFALLAAGIVGTVPATLSEMYTS